MKFSTAILVSVAFHAVLAAGIGLYLAHAPAGVVSAELDLSSVELSFAEEESEAAPSVASAPSAAVAGRPPYRAPEEMTAPPEPTETPLPAPPDAAAIKLPEPAEKPSEMDNPAPSEEPSEMEESPRGEESEANGVPRPPEPAVTRKDSASASPAAPAAPRQARVDAPPTLKKTIRPDYPRGARKRGEEGDVALEIAVDAEGGVAEVRIVSACPYAELNEAAVKAVRKARFTPARQGSDAVACTVRWAFTFRLRD